MAEEWSDKKFSRWIQLREKYKKIKQNKDYLGIINVSKEIIEYDKEAKFIGIMVPLFQKDIANAYLKLDDKINAIIYIKNAINGFREYRNNNKLNNSSDFIKDIETLEKKLTKLENKK